MERVAVNVRIRPEVKRELERQAKEQERSITKQVEWLVMQEGRKDG